MEYFAHDIDARCVGDEASHYVFTHCSQLTLNVGFTTEVFGTGDALVARCGWSLV